MRLVLTVRNVFAQASSGAIKKSHRQRMPSIVLTRTLRFSGANEHALTAALEKWINTS